VNYGWPRIEAAQTMTGMRTPVTFYNPAIAPSGVSFYRGQVFALFRNNLFVATLRGLHLLRLRLDSGGHAIESQERLLENEYGRIRDVVTGPDGFLYFATSNGRGGSNAADDRIGRIVPAS
jgi:aldose sugar dehydrogenase